ncbi:hypothetical protein K2173_003575 [Erythroxylum novogranatense]|uniref:Peptidase A1 domain-containing protein n=1 Tax=Erythroxylum novogranatense TaxID=1862640 RepID=A0AAV8TC70_9ROSI|nr:hypothetical protein K2173_003575 [Erythroxylum novogranatense]
MIKGHTCEADGIRGIANRMAFSTANRHLALGICHIFLFLSCDLKWVHGARTEALVHVLKETKSVLPLASCPFSTKGCEQQFQGVKRSNCRFPRSALRQQNLHPGSSKIIRNQSRVRSLNSVETRLTYSTEMYGEGLSLPLSSLTDGNYVVKLGFGTPTRDFNLLFDTGSDITWIKCQPCFEGCNSGDSIFDPSSSSTYSNATCDSPTCSYRIPYNDDSYAVGDYSKDTLTMTTEDVYSGFVFGCSHNIGGDFGGADGVLGIGQGNYSLMAQTDKNLFRVFCYCLPSTESSTGYLAFGVQAFETCQPDTSQMIPLIFNQNDQDISFFVNLTGITIGDQRLEISSYIQSSVKTKIDSGTVITRLPQPLYLALQSEFARLMSPYPPAPPSQFLNTCYNLERHISWTPPEVVLHFEDYIDVNLDQSAIAIREDEFHVCLAFAANNGTSELIIIGNQQQRALNVFYDAKTRKLAFGPGCTN